MVNFRDPVIVTVDAWALLKLCHTMNGLYIWEFFTTLDFEWRVIRGRQPYRWTIWLYSLTRFCTLMAVACNLVTLNVTAPTNCQALNTINFILAYMTFALSSLLIILRIIAIWNKNKVIVGLSTLVWGINGSFLVQGLAQIRSTWVADGSFCSIPNLRSNMANVISMFVTDFFLLVIMLVGLYRLRCRVASKFALAHFLWKQGLLWLLLTTIAELPPLVFLCLNLNGAFDMMFLTPSLMIMSIAATRMYRSLADFASATEVVVDSVAPPRIGRNISNSNSNFAVPNAARRVDVAVHTSRERYPTSLTDRDILYIGHGRPEQACDTPHGSTLDVGAESSV